MSTSSTSSDSKSPRKNDSVPPLDNKTLTLKILEARNLAAKDMGGTSDPYCLITVTGARSGSKVKTKVMKKNLNPVWNEKYEFEITNEKVATLNIECWDEDFWTPDDFLGKIEIPITSLPTTGETVDKWIAFQRRKEKPKEKISGDLHIILSYHKQKRNLMPDDFELVAVLGKGTFGKVYQVKKKDNGKIYAMKVLKKSFIIKQREVEHTLAERHILKSIKHPFMINMRYSFQTETKLYIVLDYVNGGELFFHLQNERRFSEERTRFYAAEIILALEYLHIRGIIYRDLKPENVLVEESGHIRITDFGLSKEGLFQVDDRTSTFCGTPAYLPPEVIQQKSYGKEIDWWSFGNLIFEMLTGLPPFYSVTQKSVQEMYDRILTGEIHYPSYMSETAKSLLSELLNVDVTKRLGYRDDSAAIKKHPFFKEIDFDKLLERKVPPPFIPKVKGEKDLSQFDPLFTKENPNIERDDDHAKPLSKHEQAQFSDFYHESGEDDHAALSNSAKH